jgi:uncharacterized peroxidase-related enzyme
MTDAVLDAPKLTTETAEPAGKQLLAEAEAKLGFVPNMYGYMANLPDLLRAYLSAYDDFRANAGFTPPEQEVIFLTISVANSCGYCVAAHSMLAEKKSGVPADSLAALREGRTLPDAKLEALRAFTHAMVETRGEPGKAAVDAFLAAGFETRHVFGIILAIGVKTFSNYTNHLTGTEIDTVFAGHAQAA